jgi:hypothetical protein
MARFIVDIANVSNSEKYAQMLSETICEAIDNKIVTVVCIDKTNEAQFYTEKGLNQLTPQQIETANQLLGEIY